MKSSIRKLEYNRNYRKEHKDELREKRRERYRARRNSTVADLIADYTGGMTVEELQTKYYVRVRKAE